MMLKYTYLTFLILVNSFYSASAIIAYDCQNVNMNITTFSLVETGSCKVQDNDVVITKEKIQLVQINDFEIVPVKQCKIHVIRQIHYCGMHSHISAVTNGLASYIHSVSKNMCEDMHKHKALNMFYGKVISQLVINGTSYATVLMAGKMTSENSCVGSDYEDHKGRWTNVIVQAALEISLYEEHAPVDVNNNQIALSSGTVCPYKEKTCIDSVRGHRFWENIDSNQCSESRYTVLYEGEATKLNPRKSDMSYETPIYSVDHGEKIFAMPINKPTIICGQTAYETDHPKFYIIKPSESGLFYFTKKIQHVFNMDPTAYTNAKVVFVERHIRGQIIKLYADVTDQKCALEQQVLRNLQTLAVTAPAEFAYTKMKTPGYTAVNFGEVVHIIKCTPVEVKIRTTERCYHELPVTHDNKTLFMSPRNRILQKYATEIGCDPFLYPAYQLNSKWYKTSKDISEIPSPQIIEPINQNQWKYTSPVNLFKGGIYTQEDMIKLQQHLLLPTERQAVSDIITGGVTGLTTDMQGTKFDVLVNENMIHTWMEKTWGKMWNWFTNLGIVTSGLMGIILIGKLIKLIVDTIIHGMVLHQILGWSIRLVAALFDSLTMYLVHTYHSNKDNGKTNDKQEDNVNIQVDPVERTAHEQSDHENTAKPLYPAAELEQTTSSVRQDWLK